MLAADFSIRFFEFLGESAVVAVIVTQNHAVGADAAQHLQILDQQHSRARARRGNGRRRTRGSAAHHDHVVLPPGREPRRRVEGGRPRHGGRVRCGASESLTLADARFEILPCGGAPYQQVRIVQHAVHPSLFARLPLRRREIRIGAVLHRQGERAAVQPPRDARMRDRERLAKRLDLHAGRRGCLSFRKHHARELRPASGHGKPLPEISQCAVPRGVDRALRADDVPARPVDDLDAGDFPPVRPEDVPHCRTGEKSDAGVHKLAVECPFDLER